LGLTVIVGSVIGGWLIERYSVLHLVTACAISSGSALILLLAGGRWESSKPNV
jgi:hypothetical protein